MDKPVLAVGVKLKEVATVDGTFVGCTVLHSDPVGIVFEVERTVAEGGTIESVVSQVFIPWSSVRRIVIVEERT